MISPASMSGAVFDGSWSSHATTGASATNTAAMPRPSMTCMRRPACWTRRALSGSCAANRETAWIVPVTSTLLNSDAIELTRLYAPKTARDRIAGRRNWITKPTTMK